MPSRNQKVTYGQVTIERDGKTYVANRTIMGTRKLSQTIEYQGIVKTDAHPYTPHQTNYMNSIAQLLLSEIIDELAWSKKRSDKE
jgi:hypothetical protein